MNSETLNLPYPIALEIFETISEGINIYDNDGNITYCNPASLKILNVAKEELLGLNIFKDFGNIIVIDGKTIDASGFPATESLKTKKNIIGRVIGFKNYDGRTIWINVSAYHLKSENSNFKVFVNFKEYTQTLTLLKDLYQKNFDLELMASNYPNGCITLLDNEFKIIFTGGKLPLSEQFKSHELIGQELKSVLPQNVFDELVEKSDNIVQYESFQLEFEKDGFWKRIYFQKTAQKETLSKFAMAIIDISSKKFLEKELMFEKLSYQNIIDNLPGMFSKPLFRQNSTLFM